MLLKGSWAKMASVSLLGILQEDRHLFFGIAFSHVGDVDASGGVGCLLQGDVWR